MAAAYLQLVLPGMLAESGEERTAQLAAFLDQWTEQVGWPGPAALVKMPCGGPRKGFKEG